MLQDGAVAVPDAISQMGQAARSVFIDFVVVTQVVVVSRIPRKNCNPMRIASTQQLRERERENFERDGNTP